jgi:nicotinamide riboside transporter PnuC
MNWMKLAGIADGVFLAAVVALGKAVPSWAPWCDDVAMVLGVLGTMLGTGHAAASKGAA